MESYGEHPRIPWPGEAVAKIRGRTFSGSKTSWPKLGVYCAAFLSCWGKKDWSRLSGTFDHLDFNSGLDA